MNPPQSLTHKITAFTGASYVAVERIVVSPPSLLRRPRVEGTPPVPIGGGKRGTITGLSRAARGRLLKRISKLKRQELMKGPFLTLTIPQGQVASIAATK